MSIEREKSPEELEAWVERIKNAIIEDGVCIVEMGDRAPIETLLESVDDNRLFNELTEEEKQRVLKIFKDEFGIDLKKEQDFLAKEYSMEGTSGQPGEGEIKVNVFKTNKEGVFLRRYKYQDGDESWSLGPEVLEDEE